MGRSLAGGGEGAARPGEPELADAPYGNGYGGHEQLKKKKKRSKDKHEIAAEVKETRTVAAAERNGAGEEDESRESNNNKKKKNHEEDGEGGGIDLENGGEVGKKKKKRKKVDGGVSSENDGDEKSGGSEEEEDVIEAKGVIVSGKNAKDAKYAALNTFSESGLPAEVLDCCKNFSKPSPIQSHAWPFLLHGRDFVGIAATGSGKTLAFGVPALMHILKKKDASKLKKSVPRCLVLAPTRELAQQIADVLCDAGNPCGVKSVCLYGGTSKGPQISSLKAGVDIVIGTPGRLQDLMEMGICNLKDASFVVLDEADRMLDMGFEPEVRSILSQTCSMQKYTIGPLLDPGCTFKDNA